LQINPYLNFPGNTDLNFPGNTEEAFEFYRTVFGGEFSDVMRFKDMPADDEMSLPPEDLNKIMHISLPVGSFILMGTDMLESMGQKWQPGNNQYICLSPDDPEEARRIFSTLSRGGEIEMELQEMFWNSLFGSFRDRFGINWMIDCAL
tara:strand:- start:194698 stop:195141 length:444 start_codon:yes stop_codon:yes gene_type:complete